MCINILLGAYGTEQGIIYIHAPSTVYVLSTYLTSLYMMRSPRSFPSTYVGILETIKYWSGKVLRTRLFTNLISPDINFHSHEILCAFESCISHPRPLWFYWFCLTRIGNAQVECTAREKEQVEQVNLGSALPNPIMTYHMSNSHSLMLRPHPRGEGLVTFG